MKSVLLLLAIIVIANASLAKEKLVLKRHNFLNVQAQIKEDDKKHEDEEVIEIE